MFRFFAFLAWSKNFANIAHYINVFPVPGWPQRYTAPPRFSSARARRNATRSAVSSRRCAGAKSGSAAAQAEGVASHGVPTTPDEARQVLERYDTNHSGALALRNCNTYFMAAACTGGQGDEAFEPSSLYASHANAGLAFLSYSYSTLSALAAYA